MSQQIEDLVQRYKEDHFPNEDFRLLNGDFLQELFLEASKLEASDIEILTTPNSTTFKNLSNLFQQSYED